MGRKTIRKKYEKRMAGQPSFQFKGDRSKKRYGRFAKNWCLWKNLEPRDWSGVKLEEIKKDFYQEHPSVKARDEAMIKEYMDQNRISVKGRDCPKPVEAFDEFCFSGGIMDAIKVQNFVKPTPIQSQAIPVALSGRDMVGIADTGSGKTLAFILPAITHILGNNHPRNVGEPEVMVLAPTRELAQQIHQVVVSLGPGIGVKSACFYGGASRTEQATLTENIFEICIATPGRMADFLSEGFVKLHRCTFFVLDEADRMLDMGFEPQIKLVIGQSRPDRQMLMFSATWPQEIQNLAECYLKDYILVNVGSLGISANHNITQKVEFCEETEKPRKIVKLMKEVMKEEENKTLIFVNSKLDVDVLTLQFRLNGWEAMGLHGSKKQIERDQVFNDFKTGKIHILIATDLAARGLDVDDIKYIVNYDYPVSSEDYVHRIGRTARCNRKGTAITLFTQRDRGKAKDLISVLQEAGQYVPPHLQKAAHLPPISRKNIKSAISGTRKKKKELKKLLKGSKINSVPLGSATDSNSLPDLDEVTILAKTNLAREDKSSTSSGGKNKRKLQLVNSENKVEEVQSQPSSSKKAKMDSYVNSSNRCTDDHDSGDFDNPHWAPIANSQKYEQNSRNTPARNLLSSDNFENSHWAPSAHSQKYEQNSSNTPARNLLSSDNFENPHWAPSANSQKYETSRNISAKSFSSANPPATGSVNTQNLDLDMKSREVGRNSGIPFSNTRMSADVRRETNIYSTDYRNTSMPMNSRNYETSFDPRSSGPSMNTGNMRMPMGSADIRVSGNGRNMGMHMNPRSTEQSFSARNQAGDSFDRRQNDTEWNGAPAWRNPTYNNYTSHQASNWGQSRNNYSMNRMDINHYPGQNWSGRSGYNQY